MPIQFVAGDLFDNEHSAQALAHGCNCQGSMGAGVARTFRARYPAMFEEYRRRCKSAPRQFNLGDCWLWRADDQPWVFNLGTQEGIWRARASYDAIEAALRAMRQQADAEAITRVAIPRIGVGYGGLSWRKVRAIVEAVFHDWDGSLVVYEDFVPGASASAADPAQARTSQPEPVSASPRARKSKRAQPIKTAGDEGREGTMNVVNFYAVSAAYGCFSNFSPHPITVGGKTWPTSEHYFQGQKFAGAPDEEEIRQTASPMIAARMGRSRKRPLRPDWEAVKDRIMHDAVLAKFTQHADLCETLLQTGDATIVEHTANDAYWGDGGDGHGRNMLGQILMRVRDELRGAGTES